MKSDVPVLSRHTAEDTEEELGIDQYGFFISFQSQNRLFLESDQKNVIFPQNMQWSMLTVQNLIYSRKNKFDEDIRC